MSADLALFATTVLITVLAAFIFLAQLWVF